MPARKAWGRGGEDGGDKFKWSEKKPTDWPDDTGDSVAAELV